MGKSASKAEDAHDNSNKRWFKMSTKCFYIIGCTKQSKANVNGGKKANDFYFVLFCVTLVPAEQ